MSNKLTELESKVPRLEKFCFCFEVHLGVKIGTLFLVGLWVVYFLISIFGGGGLIGWLWGLIFTSANIVSFLCVLYGIRNHKQIFLKPALILSVIDVFLGTIEAIVNFFMLRWLSAVWVLAIAILTCYYTIALKNVHDDIGAGPETVGEPTTV